MILPYIFCRSSRFFTASLLAFAMVLMPQRALQQRACAGISPDFPCSAFRSQNKALILMYQQSYRFLSAMSDPRRLRRHGLSPDTL